MYYRNRSYRTSPRHLRCNLPFKITSRPVRKSRCSFLAEVDRKIDDGVPNAGNFHLALSGQRIGRAYRWNTRAARLHQCNNGGRDVERHKR